MWADETVFYQIYPQSFKDTDGDGIGDINGIIEKLDYIKWLGCNALWLNPCFESSFQDAGYDVTCLVRGLGELPAIQDIFVKHAQAAIDKLNK